ncbi:hypothetical protein [Streptomyces sp. NPDC014733]|uniref:hypothetical protein n=1 Tax=Streptomyces sp. NPDC014733 TaxID=3364885 RepID=UPI003701E27D
MSGSNTPIYEGLIEELGDVPGKVKATAESELEQLRRDFGFGPVRVAGNAAGPEGHAHGRFPRALSA